MTQIKPIPALCEADYREAEYWRMKRLASLPADIFESLVLGLAEEREERMKCA